MSDRHASLTLWESGFRWARAPHVAYRDVHVADAAVVTYAASVWESPVVELPFAARELIPSWNARTPAGTWLHVEGRVGDAAGWTPWVTFARWAEDDPDGQAPMTRTTVRGQQLDAGAVAADTWRSAPGRAFERWQLRLTALATAEALEAAEALDGVEGVEGVEAARVGVPSGTPVGGVTVSLAGAVASRFAIAADAPTSRPGAARGHEVPVPAYSQRLHLDTFPHWDKGGQSWCSPTSTTMLLEHWGSGPSAEEAAWVGHQVDPVVVHGVRRVFDRSYGGAGNWAFNTAYAGTRGLRAYVTRLRDLTEAEAFVAAGVPLVVSVTFREGELDGAGYETSGHLLTVVGFTETGDVVSNDPNSHRVASNDEVRTVYRRDQFERVWLGTNGGLAYVIHPHGVALPTPPAEANWA